MKTAIYKIGKFWQWKTIIKTCSTCELWFYMMLYNKDWSYENVFRILFWKVPLKKQIKSIILMCTDHITKKYQMIPSSCPRQRNVFSWSQQKTDWRSFLQEPGLWSNRRVFSSHYWHPGRKYENDEIGVYETLRLTNCIPGQCYLLPKIHKEEMPGRPIASAIGNPTEKISEYIDLHLRPHVEDLRTYIEASRHYRLSE